LIAISRDLNPIFEPKHELIIQHHRHPVNDLTVTGSGAFFKFGSVKSLSLGAYWDFMDFYQH